MTDSPFRLIGTRTEARVVLPFQTATNRIRDLVCYEHDGDLLYEGDIIVERASAMLNLAPQRAIGRLGHFISDRNKKWPGGVIPVAVPADMRSIVEEAIAVWEATTPLRFPTFSNETDYVSLAFAGHNASSVGRKTGPQILYLEEDAKLRIVVHELGHAVGLYHEHSRPDADQYIELHPDNMSPGAIAQFSQPTQSDIEGAYDYDSVMHYDRYAFSRNQQPTITVRNGAEIGHLSELSDGDLQACRSLYDDLSWA